MVESKTLQEAYKVMQAAWVELYNVEVGDTVRVIRCTEEDELGYRGCATNAVGHISTIRSIYGCDGIRLNEQSSSGSYWFPFFCLEVVKKTEPKIEITCKINGETMPLSTLSEETILNIRRSSK